MNELTPVKVLTRVHRAISEECFRDLPELIELAWLTIKDALQPVRVVDGKPVFDHPMKDRLNAIRAMKELVSIRQDDTQLEARLQLAAEQHFQTLASQNEQFAERIKRLDSNKPTDIIGYLSLEERESRRSALITSLRAKPTVNLSVLDNADNG